MDYANQAYMEYAKKNPLPVEMSTDDLQTELNRFWDGVLLTVAKSTGDTRVRNAYQLMVQQARAQSDMLNWLDAPEVFYSTASAQKGKRRMPWIGLAAAVLLAALTVWFAIPYKGRNIWYACIVGTALVLSLLQYLILHFSVPTAPAQKIRTEQRVSPDRVRNGLKRLANQVDGNAESLVAILSEDDAALPDMDLSLARDLMRLPMDKRSAAVSEAVDRFLVRQGVERVDYSPEKRELFMLLPSSQELTVEPALLKNGQVLYRGVACTKMED